MSDDFDLREIIRYLKPKHVALWVTTVCYVVAIIAGTVFLVVKLVDAA